MGKETVIEIEGNKYGEVVIIEEYNGKYSLCSGRVGRDGGVYKNWAFPQDKNKNPRETAVPIKINIGDEAAAREMIFQIEYAFKALTEKPELRENNKADYGKAVKDDDKDIPF